MRFKIGQEVVCITKYWIPKPGATYGNNDPKHNEIVVIEGYDTPVGIFEFVILKGYKECSYIENRFAPILENLDEIEETLSHEFAN